jgi:hypothetical protein
MGHEVGHALYTPIEGCIREAELKLNHGICNIVEDVRIEKKMKYKYPGLRNSFVKAYRDLYDKDFFGTQGANIQQFNFIDRVNLHTKVGTYLGIKFNQEERELLREIENTETYDDVLDVSRKVMDFMQKQAEEQRQQVKLELGDEAEENDDPFEMDFDLDSNEEFTTEEVENNDAMDGKDAPDADIEQEAPIQSFTDEAYRQNQEKLFESNARDNVYANIPKVDLDKIVMDFKEFLNRYMKSNHSGYVDYQGYNKTRNENNKAVSYLVKEFEMRKNAEQMKRASVAKTGELNMSKIYSYNFNDDIFKKMTIVPEGKSHGLVMFLDWSGSMANHMENTVKQLLTLTSFCKKVNIPFEVYSFVDNAKLDEFGRPVKLEYKQNDIMLNKLTLINILSSRMTAMELTKAGAILTYVSKRPRFAPSWMTLHGTPLNETIIAAFEIIPKFKQQYKLQIVNTVFLTDGAGHSLRQRWDYNPRTQTFSDVHITERAGQERSCNVIFTDPVTKHQQKMDNDRNDQTGPLIKLLKERTGCNVMGFYVLFGREFGREAWKFWPRATNFDALKIEFRKNKFAIAHNAGFDEYYLLRSEALDTEEDTELEVKENATTRGLVSAFKKYAGARVSNRVVLNRFIGLIA